VKHILVVLVLCLAPAGASLAQQAGADQPASAAEIEQLYQVMHVREQMKTTIGLVAKSVRQMMHEQIQRTPNLPPDAEQRMDKTFDATLEKMPIEELLQAMVPVYQRHLSESDVKAMIAFYSTPTGKKVLAEMPAISAEAMQASSGIIRKYMTDTREQIQSQIDHMAQGTPTQQ
jgi:hypothetical protein